MQKTDARLAVKSADRVLDVFELFARWEREMSHAEIAERLDIPKSSLSQLINTLVVRGYLELCDDKKSYRLGESIAKLARRKARSSELRSLALPVLAELTQSCGESSALNVVQGDYAQVVATVLAHHRLVSHMREGDTAPLYATSAGKAMLAQLPASMLEDYLSHVVFEATLPNTISDAKILRGQLETIRKEHVAYSFEEYTLGIVGIGIAIGEHDDVPLGALSIAMPTVRYNDKVRDEVIEKLTKAAIVLYQRVKDAATSD